MTVRDRALRNEPMPIAPIRPAAKNPFAWRKCGQPPELPPLGFQRLQSVKMIGVAITRLFGELQARQAVEQDRQHSRQFETGERRADAETDAGAEGHMRIGLASGVEGVGVRKTLRIAIGGAKQQADPLALLEGDAGELHVLERVALKEMQRRVEPQELLDRRRAGLPARKGCARIDAAFEHRLHPVADGVDRRLMAGVEQKDAGGDEFVLAEPAAVVFGNEKLADEVVSEVGPAGARVAAHETGEAASAALSSTARVTPNWYIATIRCDQSSIFGPSSRGTPSRSAMTATGIGAAKASMRSAEPSRS